MRYFTPDFLEFYKELAANNHKEWMDAHRTRYEQVVKVPMEAFVADMLQQMFGNRVTVTKPSECIFRINRDIRFSKDKTPYKLHASSYLAADGKKSLNQDGFYVELSPERLALGYGVYNPTKEQLADIRNAIAANPKVWSKTLTQPKFIQLWGNVQGERIKRIPAEFQAAAELCPFIANKQFYVWAELDAQLIVSEKLASTLLTYYHAASDFNQLLSKALSS